MWLMLRAQLAQGLLQFLRLKSKRAGLALVSHASVGVDEVDPIGPAGVGALGCVTEFVEHGGKLDAQLAYARSGHDAPLLFISRTREDDLVFDVALHLPYVAGMGFQNVDNQERHAVAILFVESVESGNLPPERRSGVTAEYEHHRLVRGERRELHAGGFIELEQGEVGSRLARMQFAGALVRPERFEGQRK